MARAQYKGNAIKLFTEADGSKTVQIVPTTSITLYEAGTATLLTGSTVFAGPTGVTTLGNPFTTDADGNIVFYLAQARRVKIVAVGVNYGPLVADYEPVLHDPADLIASGQTAFVTLAGGLAVSSADPAAPVLEVRSDTAMVAAGLRIGGTQGSTNPIRVLKKDGSTVLFNVEQGASETGTVTTRMVVPLANSTYTMGSASLRWLVIYGDFLYSSDGSAGGPSQSYFGDSTTGRYRSASPQGEGVSVNSVSVGLFTAAGLALPGALSLGSLPATAGAIRLTNATSILADKALSAGNMTVARTDASDNLILGDSSGMGITFLQGTSAVVINGGTVSQMTIGPASVAIAASAGIALGFFGAGGTTRQTIAAAASDPATTQALANSIRTILLAHGFVA